MIKNKEKETKETNEHKDCLAELISLASTTFEKKAVIEFAAIERKLAEELSKIKTELKYIKWLTITIFVTSILLKLIGG
jgi:hypothetical protein